MYSFVYMSIFIIIIHIFIFLLIQITKNLNITQNLIQTNIINPYNEIEFSQSIEPKGSRLLKKIDISGVPLILIREWVYKSIDRTNEKYYDEKIDLYAEYWMPDKKGYYTFRDCKSYFGNNHIRVTCPALKNVFKFIKFSICINVNANENPKADLDILYTEPEIIQDEHSEIAIALNMNSFIFTSSIRDKNRIYSYDFFKQKFIVQPTNILSKPFVFITNGIDTAKIKTKMYLNFQESHEVAELQKKCITKQQYPWSLVFGYHFEDSILDELSNDINKFLIRVISLSTTE